VTERVDVTILGGGPVGLFGAFYAGLRGMSVRIIDSLPELGGQLTALYPEKYVYDMPGFPAVLAKDLAQDLVRQASRFQPDLVLEETAQHLRQDADGYVITTHKGTDLPTRTLVISAGAGAFTPTKIGVPREEDLFGKGLAYGVKSKELYRGKDVMIVGGGDSAFDWALNLHPIAKSIKLVHRRDQFRAHEESIRELQSTSAEFHLWKVVAELHGEDHLTGVTLENTQTKEREFHSCDEVVVNIGFKSSLGPLKDWGLTIEKNQIVVDHLYQTNLPGVFAVGDVCNFEGKLKLIATGVGEAATAVCIAKTMIDPTAKLFPGHSSDLDLSAHPASS
jgi:thioredoxin reductase (NADPH)